MELRASVLQPVVGHALDASAVPVHWSVAPILAGDGQGLGVFRVSGSARVSGELCGWSVILKVLPMTRVSPSGWDCPEREALAYESGLLVDLPPGLEAPRCFGHSEHEGRRFLWLEDLGADVVPWRLEDFGTAAQALGRFNGAYLGSRQLPEARWLSQQWLRSWLDEGSSAMGELPRVRRHPLVKQVYPGEVVDGLLRLWARREEVLDALDRLPQVFSHNDAFRRNLFLKSDRLVAVDWAFLGPQPVGAELAPLVSASVALRGIPHARWRDLERTAVEAYLVGLQDTGWRGAPDLARFGYAASSALRYGPGCVRLVLPALLDETAQAHVEVVLGIPFDQVLQLWAATSLEQQRLANDTFSRLESLNL
ncbi:MAG: hypothetical protein WA994_02210 [Ornithinimicrobium sp.]